MEEIRSFLDTVKVGPSQSHQNLSIFPLMGPDAGPPDFLTLEEALTGGSVRISEVSESGHVPELRLVNDSPKAVLVVDGEELVGAKQNRIVNATFLIGGHATVVIPVSCVEEGRWSYRSPVFDSGEKVMHASLRRDHQKAVAERLADGRGYESDQGMIWRALSSKAARMSVHSRTGAMADLFQASRDRLDDFIGAFRLVDCQLGAAFGLNGQVVGLECFLHQATFQKFFHKLVKSYALDALDFQAPEGHPIHAEEDPRAFVEAVKAAEARVYPAIGLGRSVRFEGAGVFGAALVHEGKVLHLNAFARDKVGAGSREVRFQRFSQRRKRRL
jgi:hypothetical protein